MSHHAFFVLLLAIGGGAWGCARQAHRPPAPDHLSPRTDGTGLPPREQVEAWEHDLGQREEGLQRWRVESQVDCPRACRLVAEICELGDRICKLTAAHADDPALSSRCGRARTRCTRARQSVAPFCGC